MLQSAIDLSKQWPQAILRVGLGINFFAMIFSWASGSNLKWLDALSTHILTKQDASLIFASIFLLAHCYVMGSIFASSGETTLLGFDTKFRVKMAADVFETGNGLLIHKYQDAIRNAQLFGGLMSSIFFGGISVAILSILTGEEGRFLSEVYGISGEDSAAPSEPKMSWLNFILITALSLGLFVGLRRAVRQMTTETFFAIAVEIELRRAERNA